MPFDATDLYTVSAGVNLYNYWNPFVTKFDTSAFYHWEQDNLPLYDLEERTDYLWEKLGYPTSSLPGLVLAVSSTIPTHLSVSSNVFTSLQDAIDALPEIIRFPTLIEVAASGDLGSVSLDNIKCMGDGALEIVNRVYTDLSGSDSSYKTVNVSGAGSTVSSVDARTTLNDTSCLLLSAQTSSLFDTNADGVYICTNKHLNNNQLQSYLTLGIGNDSTQTASITSTAFEMEAHDVKLSTSPAQDKTIDYESVEDKGTDLRADSTTRATYGRGDISPGVEKILGMAAGNYLRSVTISNCDGPIYLRKFVVNAASGTTTATNYGTTSDIGIHVSNTEGLRIEDCATARAKKVGLQVDNSNIEINRKFYSLRNYDQDSRGTEDDAGILANNSNIEFLQEGVSSDAFDSQIVVSQQMRGVHLVNSKIIGGLKSNASLSNGSLLGALSCETGFELDNSVIDLDGVLDTFACQSTGLKATGSKIRIDSSVFQGNASKGMDLKNSTCEYNKNLTNITSYPTMGATIPNYLHQQTFSYNGQHVVCDESKFYHKYGVSIPQKSGSSCYYVSTGASKVHAGNVIRNKPSIELNKSEADFVHANIFANLTGSESVRGCNIAANNQSTARLKGSSKNASCAILNGVKSFGVNLYADNNSNIELAGQVVVGDAGTAIMADNGSTVSFSPHSVADSNSMDVSGWDLSSSTNHTNIEVAGRNNCIVANNNSTVYMRDLGSFSACHGTINSTVSSDAIDSYKDSAQYTSGGSFSFYPNCETALANEAKPTLAVRGAKAKFFANANPTTRTFTAEINNSIDYNDGLGLQSASIEDYRAFSHGGICVRALNNSVVDVQNVNFLAGPVNADEVFLDPSQNKAGGCNDLRIWAFGGGSKLNTSLLSVSSAYPSEPGYTGPRGIYYTDTTFDISAAAYTAFSGLPYNNGNDAAGSALPLSGLAILDFFGLGASALSGLSGVDSSSGEKYFRGWSKLRFGSDNPYGFGTSANYQNYGPYRLYLEIDPAAKALKYLRSDLTVEAETDNRPYQTIAQGYFLSADCSAAAETATDVHYSLYRVDPNTSSLESSGYYHVSSFCRPDSYNIMLDETGANTFANAKNASIEILGRPKLVNIYTPTTGVDGEANINDTSGCGMGFISTNIFDPDRQY